MAQGLRYVNQPTRFIIGSSAADSTLTTSFNDNQDASNAGGFTQLTMYVAYTPAESGRTMSIQVETSPDNVTFYPVVTLQDVTPFDGTARTADFIKFILSTGTSEVRRRFVYPLADKFVRVSVKEDGSNHGTINVVQTLSGA